jgi:hypothetical protein
MLDEDSSDLCFNIIQGPTEKSRDIRKAISCIDNALDQQTIFEKVTNPWETSKWPLDKLLKFFLFPNNIKCIFYSEVTRFDDKESIEFVCSATYEKEIVFVYLLSGYEDINYDEDGFGFMYISSKPEYFFPSIPQIDKDAVCQYLLKEGYPINVTVFYSRIYIDCYDDDHEYNGLAKICDANNVEIMNPLDPLL